jgi:hypothetical protein
MLNFLGIGAQKCGTTWLFRALSRHPSVRFPAGKEVHFWDRPGDRREEWYWQQFADQAHINGEITPAYGCLPREKIQRIQSWRPDLKLIYLIRNPIDRAWSAARMALSRAELLHNEVSDQWFIDHFRSSGSMARGDFETCIRQWQSVYPVSQLLVLRFESIIDDPIGTVNRCLDHIGVQSKLSSQDREALASRVFSGDNVRIRPSLIPVLQEIYAPRISSLEAFLGEDLRAWSQPATLSISTE